MEGLLQEGEEEWRARMAKGKSGGSSDGIWKRYWIVEIGKRDRGMKRDRYKEERKDSDAGIDEWLLFERRSGWMDRV